MGLGLFDAPLYLNPKCIIFSLFIIIIYYLPKPYYYSHHFVMMFLLGTSAYIGMAWYDVLYDCNDKFGPTYLGWMTKIFKPPQYSSHYESLPIKYKKRIRNIDIIILLVIVITFIYPFIVK
jgi:hypothetical protein